MDIMIGNNVPPEFITDKNWKIVDVSEVGRYTRNTNKYSYSGVMTTETWQHSETKAVRTIERRHHEDRRTLIQRNKYHRSGE